MDNKISQFVTVVVVVLVFGNESPFSCHKALQQKRIE